MIAIPLLESIRNGGVSSVTPPRQSAPINILMHAPTQDLPGMVCMLL